MKTCTHCFRELPFADFNYKDRTTGTRQPDCRECTRRSLRDHYRRNRAYYLTKATHRNAMVRRDNLDHLMAYLREHPCVDCGEGDLAVLEFDHSDRSSKLSTVSALLRQRSSWSRVRIEIDKCDVRCANCHRRRTAQQFAWYRLAQQIGGRSREGAGRIQVHLRP